MRKIRTGGSQKEVPRRGGIFNVSAIVIPSCFKGKPITKIGKACNDRYNIFEVNIPDSVVHIDDKAFRCCYNLESFIVPPSVKTIGREAFYCCPELESIVISNGVERIEKQAFWECSRLRSVVIPDSVTFIGDKVFLVSLTRFLQSKNTLSEINLFSKNATKI